MNRRLKEQHGYALPVVMMLLMIAGTLVAAAAAGAFGTQHQAARDRNVQKATAAANGAVELALYRLNMMLPGDTQCVGTSGTLSLTTAPAGGWCPEEVSLATDHSQGEATYSYRVSTAIPVGSRKQRSIVATGYADGVKVRIAEVAQLQNNVSIFGPYAAIAFDADPTAQFNVANDAAVYEDCARNTLGTPCEADIYTAGQVNIGGGSATVCGRIWEGDGTVPVTHGALNPPTGTIRNLCPAGNTGAPSVTTNGNATVGNAGNLRTDLVPVANIPQGAPTAAASDNTCITRGFAGSAQACSSSGAPPASFEGSQGSDGSVFTTPAGAAAPELILNNAARLHLKGGRYVFCYLELRRNSDLVIDQPTQIYLLSPEQCGGSTAPPNTAGRSEQTWGSFPVMSSGGAIVNNAAYVGGSQVVDAKTLQIFLAGSATYPTYFKVGGNLGQVGTDEFTATIWAPNSIVDLNNDGSMTGAVAGKQVNVNSNFRLKYTDTAATLTTPNPFYRGLRVTQCSATPPGPEFDSGCDR